MTPLRQLNNQLANDWQKAMKAKRPDLARSIAERWADVEKRVEAEEQALASYDEQPAA